MLFTLLKIPSPRNPNWSIFFLNHIAQKRNSTCFEALPAPNATEEFRHASCSLLVYFIFSSIAIEKRRET